MGSLSAKDSMVVSERHYSDGVVGKRQESCLTVIGIIRCTRKATTLNVVAFRVQMESEKMG